MRLTFGTNLLTIQAHNPEQEEAEDQIEVGFTGRGDGDRLQCDLPAGCAGGDRRRHRRGRPDRRELSSCLIRAPGDNVRQIRRHADAALSARREPAGARGSRTCAACSKSRLELHPHVNLITGANGSGKTSLLEAIYLLGRGRSFRTRHTEQLIAHDTRSAVRCLAEPMSPSSRSLGLGFDRVGGPAGAASSGRDGAIARRAVRASSRCRSSIRGSIGWSRRARPTAGAGSTGQCSTWNQVSWTLWAELCPRAQATQRGPADRAPTRRPGSPSWCVSASC